MDVKEQQTNVAILSASLKRQQIGNLILSAFAFILFFMYVGAKGDVRDILTPTNLTREISIKGKTMDTAYLEETGTDIAGMMLTVNPRTISANKDRILRIAHPSAHAELTHRIDLLQKKLDRDNAAQVFWPQQVLADPASGQVAVYGMLWTYINDKRVASEDKVFVVGLSWSGNKIWLSRFDETTANDPFVARQAASQQQQDAVTITPPESSNATPTATPQTNPTTEAPNAQVAPAASRR